jgi:hypothetical protein
MCRLSAFNISYDPYLSIRQSIKVVFFMCFEELGKSRVALFSLPIKKLLDVADE